MPIVRKIALLSRCSFATGAAAVDGNGFGDAVLVATLSNRAVIDEDDFLIL